MTAPVPAAPSEDRGPRVHEAASTTSGSVLRRALGKRVPAMANSLTPPLKAGMDQEYLPSCRGEPGCWAACPESQTSHECRVSALSRTFASVPSPLANFSLTLRGPRGSKPLLNSRPQEQPPGASQKTDGRKDHRKIEGFNRISMGSAAVATFQAEHSALLTFGNGT